jgi:hypothetical protein
MGGKNGNSIELYTSYLQISTRPLVPFGGRFCIKFSLSLLPLETASTEIKYNVFK